MNNYDIIIKPVLSEKAFGGIGSKVYTFKVAKTATKPQIKNAIEEIFKVKVEKINVMNYDGKPKKQGRHEGLTPSWKKAIVWLTPSSKAIEFFESLK